MKLDPKTTRLLGRITDRMDLIRKNPHRYEIDADVMTELAEVAGRLEGLLTRIQTIKAG
jgi:hypothetical protein